MADNGRISGWPKISRYWWTVSTTEQKVGGVNEQAGDGKISTEVLAQIQCEQFNKP